MDEINAVEREPPNIIPYMDDFIISSVFHVSHDIRERLLQEPSILLVTSHTCIGFDHEHQCTAATGMVSVDRIRQMSEQSEDNHRPFAIEFPAKALAVSSPRFDQVYESQPGLTQIFVHTGNILPGYVMCVLDWYARALQSRNWYGFLPEDTSIEGDDKWYWAYCYAAMRLLGMDNFASRLQLFIETLIEDLATDLASYGHLLRSIQPQDPILLKLAANTAKKMLAQSNFLTQADCQMLAEHFPEFAESVNGILRGQTRPAEARL